MKFKTYMEMDNNYKNMPFLNIMASGVGLRTYYNNGKFETFMSLSAGVIPTESKCARDVAYSLNQVIINSSVVDLDLWHPVDWSSNKKKKLVALNGKYEQEDYTKLLLSYLLLLL